MTKTCLMCLTFWSGCLFAQVADRQQMIDQAALEYLQTAGNHATLYYGNEHEGHSPRILNHPYLKDAKFTKARLSYNEIIYPEVLLRLDLNRKELVAQLPGHRNIVLFQENVDFAELHGQTIIYFRSNTLRGCPSTGYYILLYSGKCKVLERQNADLMQNTQSTKLEQRFVMTTHFFLYKDDVYYSIKSKRALLKVLLPYKKELKRFISANKLYFRSDTEKFLALTVGEYEKLSGT